MSDLELGTRVRYSRVLRREGNRRKDGVPGHYKVWRPGPVDGAWGDPSKSREGIIYGLRTYTNGDTTWGWEDMPTTYDRQESVPVALVSWDIRRKPDAVFIDDLTVVLNPTNDFSIELRRDLGIPHWVRIAYQGTPIVEGYVNESLREKP